MTFLSNDNSLHRNTWHYCCVRWGGTDGVQGSTGSFWIDGEDKGEFLLSSSFLQQEDWTTKEAYGDIVAAGDPDALFVGNFWEGGNCTNPTLDTDDSFIAQFFNPTISVRDGIADFYGTGDDSIPDPEGYTFRHPLSAEVHELKIFNTYRDEAQIVTSSWYGIEDIALEPNLMFLCSTIFCERHQFT